MTTRATEQLHQDAKGLDRRAPDEVARLLARGQVAAAGSAVTAAPAIAAASVAMADTIRLGGVLHYAAAGSSGLMAAADAQELGGTFSISPAHLRIHMAGGLPTGVEMPGDTEDEIAGLEQGLAGIGAQDCLIAVSASGSTPYTVAAAKLALAGGATVIGIANTPDSPLLSMATFPVLVETPPELVAGSTRMGAGTAQKIALNMLSTLMAVHLGHIHDGMMVNLTADNIKLRQRARMIVSTIAGVDDSAAETALATSDGRVKPAVLLAMGAASLTEADGLLNVTQGNLRDAIQRLSTVSTQREERQ
ncbi:N-acetylmuramic acid 6-phosphate etherase [Shimia biformata]|uniref:N-acetylmuramic acid 6-phosphate etherase n=1 Tax=Shimia biformata TaxID=1294299 RepID=UPI00195049F1|nr:N-acetylmuramic acid 6-phosphate etherase [Shimia biformata]